MSIFHRDHFAVVVSDVHLGHHIFGDDSAVQFEKILTQLEESASGKIKHFIILGDFLDFWRDDDDALFEKYGGYLQRLSALKTQEQPKIENLHYVAGNHDYLIPHYAENEYRKLLEVFQINKAETVPPDPLILTLETEQISQEYSFEHGHQEEAAILGSLYDGICIGLCAQGRAAGNITSIIYKYLFETIGLFLGLGALISLFAQNSTIAIILGVAMVLTFLIGIIRRQTESTEKKLYHTMRKTPSKKRKEVLRKLVAQRPNRQKMIQQIPQKYRHIAEKLSTSDDILMEEDFRTSKVPIKVIGHTHHLVEGDNNTWNPGAWVEGSPCRILAISNEGKIYMPTCVLKPVRSIRTKALLFTQQMTRW